MTHIQNVKTYTLCAKQHCHFTPVYLFGDNLTTVDTGMNREPSICNVKRHHVSIFNVCIMMCKKRSVHDNTVLPGIRILTVPSKKNNVLQDVP